MPLRKYLPVPFLLRYLSNTYTLIVNCELPQMPCNTGLREPNRGDKLCSGRYLLQALTFCTRGRRDSSAYEVALRPGLCSVMYSGPCVQRSCNPCYKCICTPECLWIACFDLPNTVNSLKSNFPCERVCDSLDSPQVVMCHLLDIWNVISETCRYLTQCEDVI